jgi:putative ABC transport system permease protein
MRQLRRRCGAGPGGAPRVPLWLLGWVLPAWCRSAALGDAEEEYAERRDVVGASAARAWLWHQAIGSIGPGARLRLRARTDAGPTPRAREGRMRTVLQDLGYAVRTMRRSPSFSLVVAATLALGIAANTVVFSAVDGVVLNPFPFPEPKRLVGVGTEYPRLGEELGFFENLSPAEYLDIRSGARGLRDVVAWDMGNRQLTFGDATENVFTAFWWGDAFPTLGVQPAVGRGFMAEEIARAERVAILSHRLWTTRFGGSRSLVGETVLVNGEPYTVIGIMPPRTLIYGTELWIPMPFGAEVFPRARRQFQVLARLAPGTTLEAANTELGVLSRRIEQEHGAEHPEYAGFRMAAMTWTAINVRQLRPAALILMGAVGFVLLLVCANVANLLLARGATRGRELAVRAALGAGGGRLLRQLLTESVLLALMGGVLGVALGYLGLRGVRGMIATTGLPVPGEMALNGRVLLFSVIVVLGAGLAFGLMPALRALRFDLQRMLQDEGRSTAGGSRLRLQRFLVGVEVALALVLLVGGGLLVRSFIRLQAVDPGFRAQDVLTMRLTLPRERYSEESIGPFFRELVRRVEEIPAVEAAATASQFPPAVFMQSQFWIEGAELGAEGTLPNAHTTLASPGFFEALGVPLLRGRVFDDTDVPTTPRVAVVNEAAARRFFPGADPIGKRIKLGGPDSGSPWYEIVGVVGSTRNRGLDQATEPELFASSSQGTGANNQLFLLVRTRSEPRSVLPAVRAAVRSLDPQQPVYAIRTVEESFAASAVNRRISTVILTIFGVFALVLSAVGIYSVVAYSVSQRTREIGVRIALGAGGAAVRRMIVRQALLPVAVGGALGLAGAIALGRALNSLLFEVTGSDPATLTAVSLLFLGVAVLASYIPARRASRLDPLTALRHPASGR